MADELFLPAVSLAYGGVVLRFVAEDSDLLIRVSQPHARFRVSDDTPADCLVNCRLGRATPSAAVAVGGTGETWQLRRLSDGREEVCFLGRLGGGGVRPWMLLTLSPELDVASAVQEPMDARPQIFLPGFPLDEYIVSRLLARRGALVLHACSVLDDGNAFVFAGHSGAGKSTIAQLAEECGAEVLSDDRTIITAEAGEARAWGTPFHGSYRRGSPASARIRRVFLLAHASRNCQVPLAPGTAFGELFVRLVQPSVDQQDLVCAIDTLTRVAGMVPVAELHFAPTRAGYEQIRLAGGAP